MHETTQETQELAALVRRAQHGSGTAFDQIVRRFQDRAVAYCYGRLGDFHRAEDAAQDAFLLAFRELPALREPITFPHWFKQILFKCCDRILRRRQTRTVALEAAQEVACPAPDPLTLLQTRDRDARVHAAIALLSEAERVAVSLFYLGDHSQAEIADFLHVPVTTLKKRLQRARTRLKERMLTMVEETLRENTPSRDQRFVEGTALLQRITAYLESDTRVRAAYLAHFGENEGWGAHDDAWSSLNLHVVVADEYLDTFATERREFVRLAAGQKPLLYEEAARNAPPHGYYLMTLCDGEAGPYEVDWYWHAQSRTTLPADTRLLFDRAGLPVSDQPTPWRYLSDDEVPDALKRVWAARSEAQAWADDAENLVSLFWAMVFISARHIARYPDAERLPFGGMLQNLLRDLRSHLEQPGASKAPNAEDPICPEPQEKLNLLRQWGAQMETAMEQVQRRGAHELPKSIVPRVARFLEWVAATVNAKEPA